ncbi:hypothetical protein [Streptomyces apocyni]|uniref:hypothetical protein n=1 Tax=Streptomyces apocyni TaxID=2654677 RepID=UPI0018CFF004|nr:hypothetical protein [Streptomyces apocyni]
MVIIAKVAHLAAAHRWFFSRTVRGRGVELMVLGVSVFVVTYTVGFGEGWLGGPKLRNACSDVPGYTEDSERAFPLAHDCYLSDGTVIELVPVWVNPMLFIALAGFATGVLIAARGQYNRWVTGRSAR